jgi:hypothetical protein
MWISFACAAPNEFASGTLGGASRVSSLAVVNKSSSVSSEDARSGARTT